MTNERWTCPDKHDFIWASGVYLTKKLPQTFDEYFKKHIKNKLLKLEQLKEDNS